MTSASAIRSHGARLRAQRHALAEEWEAECETKLAAARVAVDAGDPARAAPLLVDAQAALDAFEETLLAIQSVHAARALPPGHPLRLLIERRPRDASLRARVWDCELLPLLTDLDSPTTDNVEDDSAAGHHLAADARPALDPPPQQRLALTTSTLTAAPPPRAGLRS